MAKNNRIPVKWVRDRAKTAYQKKSECYICGSTTDLELHHLHSVTNLLESWASRNGLDITTDEGILAVRDDFIDEHYEELYELVYTLCNKHHVMLHGVYGKAPSLASVPKQERWIESKKASWGVDKLRPAKSSGSFFSEFI